MIAAWVGAVLVFLAGYAFGLRIGRKDGWLECYEELAQSEARARRLNHEARLLLERAHRLRDRLKARTARKHEEATQS